MKSKARTVASAIRIGCAGWSIASKHAALFDEGGSHLARYAARFDVAEINSSFYRSHRAETYARWAAAVPRTFRFSVKLPKAITHEARMISASRLIDRFVEEVAGLGSKLGGVLVQLPPSLAYDARIASRFFAVLRRRLDVPVACEPRHASWFEPRVDVLWARYGIARVAADPPQPAASATPGDSSRWSYWRWHGSPRMYYSAYDDAQLLALAGALQLNARRNRPAWCVFDNTAHGHAITDALKLKEMLRR